MTIETAEPAAQPAAELIPTDPQALYEYLRKLTPAEHCDVADRLSVQLGGTPPAIDRAVDLVEDTLRAIAHDDLIDRLRASLAEHLATAAAEVQAARNAVDRLSAPDVFDVEYAEGGWDLRAFLDDAGRMLRAAAAANPCPPAKNGTDQ